MKFTHVVFDLDETLVLRSKAIVRILPEIFSRLKKYEFSITELEEFICYYQRLDCNGAVDKNEVFIPIIQSCAKKLEFETLNQWYYELFIQAQTLTPEARRCLSDLSRVPVTLGLLTNGPPTQWDKIRQLGLERFFGNRIVVSADIGIRKPDPGIFKVMESKIGSGTYLYVGDHLVNDIQGALGAGWSAAWLTKEDSARAPSQGRGSVFLLSSLDGLLKLIL